MKVLIDIGHPAHVHLFKNFANIFQQKGHTVLFTVRSSECEIELLKAYDFKYYVLGRKHRSLAGKIIGIVKFDLKLLSVAMKYRPDIFLSHGSIYAAHVAAMVRKPHISLEDSGNMEQPFSPPIYYMNSSGTNKSGIRATMNYVICIQSIFNLMRMSKNCLA